MIESTIGLVAGTIIGIVAATLFFKAKLKNQIQAGQQPLLQKLQQVESENRNLSNAVQSHQEKLESQKSQTVEMVSNAFHTGSELMEEMSAGLGQIQEQVNNTSGPINEINDTSSEALGMIQKSKGSMEHLRSSIAHLNEMSSLVNGLLDRMNQINEKSQVIHNIANQANLLSLNAAIEAARAGEAGRGFGVVANDMNRLSELSATSAQEISHILSDGLKDIETITSRMDQDVSTFSEASESVMTCFEKMYGVVESIGHTSQSLNRDSESAVENVKNAWNHKSISCQRHSNHSVKQHQP